MTSMAEPVEGADTQTHVDSGAETENAPAAPNTDSKAEIENAPTAPNTDSIGEVVEDQAANEKRSIQTTTEPAAPSTENAEAQPESHTPSAEEAEYVTGFPLFLLMTGLCLCIFIVALDGSVLSTAIPRITSAFDSIDDVAWYGSGYFLTNTAFQPTFGRIYTYFDIKQFYVLSIGIFELGSIICATAVNSPMLIVGRVIAGIGAAGVLGGGMLILTLATPMHKRALYLAIGTSMFGVAGCLGPVLGGVLTDRLSWRWCFWINLPLGSIASLMMLYAFKSPDRLEQRLPFKEKLQKIDFLGSVLFVGAVVSLLLALQWGGITKPWSNSSVWGCLLCFGLLSSLFVAVQWRKQEDAIIPPRIYNQREIIIGGLMLVLLQITYNVYSFYLPFYFQAVKNTSAESSGIHMLPGVASIIGSATVVGILVNKIGRYTPFMWIGGCIFTVGAGMMSTLNLSSTPAQWIGYQIIYGIGGGGPNSTPYIAAQKVLSKTPKDLASGNSIMVFHNMLGSALGVSIAQNIFTSTLVKQVVRLAPDVSPHLILNTGATHLREVLSKQQLPGVVEAYTKAIQTTFIAPIATAGILTIISLGIPNLSVKEEKVEASPEEAGREKAPEVKEG